MTTTPAAAGFTSAPTPVLEARHVERSYRVGGATESTLVLGPVDLAVRPGEFITVVGPSGCGKSTLLHIMAGLIQSSAGQVIFRGQPLQGPGPELGVVFQRYTSFPWMSVLDNVALGLKWRGDAKDSRRQRAARLVQLVGLAGFEAAYPTTLSGGMQQRLAIARSLATEPAILFMDEPFGALDAQTRAHLQSELLRIWRETGTTILFVTHDIDEAVILADRVVVLTPRPGRLHTQLAIALPRPRTLDALGTPAFREHRTLVANALEEATVAAIRAPR